MTDNPNTHEAAVESEYEIPLAPGHLQNLGILTALCSQIDFLMGEAISSLTKTPWWAMTAMLDSATTGPRLAALRKITSQVRDPKTKSLARKAVSEISRFIETRNHVIHGLWAIQVLEAQKTTKPGCYFNRQSDKPVLAEDLPKLVLRATKITRLLGELIEHISPTGAQPWTKPRRLFVANKDWDEVPDWLQAPASLRKKDYPNPGETMPKRPRPPRSSQE